MLSLPFTSPAERAGSAGWRGEGLRFRQQVSPRIIEAGPFVLVQVGMHSAARILLKMPPQLAPCAIDVMDCEALPLPALAQAPGEARGGGEIRREL